MREPDWPSSFVVGCYCCMRIDHVDSCLDWEGLSSWMGDIVVAAAGDAAAAETVAAGVFPDSGNVPYTGHYSKCQSHSRMHRTQAHC